MRDVKREAVGTADGTHVTPEWWFYPVANVKLLKWTGEGWDSHKFLDKTLTGVAQKSASFGEGAERVVHSFHHVGEGGKFMNYPPHVAKEGRYTEDFLSDDPLEFHKLFCKTQFAANEMAKVFNSRLAKVPGVSQVLY